MLLLLLLGGIITGTARVPSVPVTYPPPSPVGGGTLRRRMCTSFLHQIECQTKVSHPVVVMVTGKEDREPRSNDLSLFLLFGS